MGILARALRFGPVGAQIWQLLQLKN